jgi:hypothetical protein
MAAPLRMSQPPIYAKFLAARNGNSYSTTP